MTAATNETRINTDGFRSAYHPWLLLLFELMP
jgi:hypothetical protein